MKVGQRKTVWLSVACEISATRNGRYCIIKGKHLWYEVSELVLIQVTNNFNDIHFVLGYTLAQRPEGGRTTCRVKSTGLHAMGLVIIIIIINNVITIIIILIVTIITIIILLALCTGWSHTDVLPKEASHNSYPRLPWSPPPCSKSSTSP